MGTVNLSERRDELFGELAGQTWDLLIVGGGIVGAGVARDAAMRGLHVALIEQHDLAFGTSSRSSRLLHGGLRYLAQGRLGLVYEASHEKRILHRIAAHVAQPLPFVFPTYRGTVWPLWQLAIGVKLYDLLCGGRNLGPSRTMRADEVVSVMPHLRRDGLTGAVRYFDGLTNDARLAIDTLHAASTHRARIANYTRLEAAEARGELWHCTAFDRLSERTCTISARAVINATGPWSDRIPNSSIRLRLTKGVHLVVDRRRLPVPDAVVMAEGKRILFAIPWGERVILGTTDTDYDAAPEDVRTDKSDVAYVLGVVNASFPGVDLAPSEVIATWSGLRPLLADAKGRPSDISRRHEIRMSHPGWFDVAGGKLTTYRLIAEQVVDRVFKHLRRPSPRCSTAEAPLLRVMPPESSCLVPPAVSKEVVREACQSQWAVHLDDVMLRRTGWHYYHVNRIEIAQQACRWMAEVFGWDAERQALEWDRYQQVE